MPSYYQGRGCSCSMLPTGPEYPPLIPGTPTITTNEHSLVRGHHNKVFSKKQNWKKGFKIIQSLFVKHPHIRLIVLKPSSLSAEYTYYYHIGTILEYFLLVIDRLFQRTKVCLLWYAKIIPIQGFIGRLRKSIRKPDLHIVSILKINVYSSCKVSRCWF